MLTVKTIDGRQVPKDSRRFTYMPAADEYQGFVGRRFVRIRPEDWHHPRNCIEAVGDNLDPRDQPRKGPQTADTSKKMGD